MPKRTSKTRGLKVGDLVYHVLYSKSWVGVLLEIKEELNGLASPREVGLVAMQPATEYYDFFKKNVSTKNRISDNMGYVSLSWLFKLEEK